MRDSQSSNSPGIGVFVVLVLLTITFSTVRGQSNDDQLAKIEKSLKEELDKELPDWKCRIVAPIQGSSHVIIYHCELRDILVKIAITEYQNAQRAEALFKETRDEQKRQGQIAGKNLVKEDLSNLGDEGYVWDIIGSEAVIFRKGKFLASISVPRPNENKDVFFSRMFAPHVAKVLDDQ